MRKFENDPSHVFGNDPRLLGAQNDVPVPGSQNGFVGAVFDNDPRNVFENGPLACEKPHHLPFLHPSFVKKKRHFDDFLSPPSQSFFCCPRSPVFPSSSNFFTFMAFSFTEPAACFRHPWLWSKWTASSKSARRWSAKDVIDLGVGVEPTCNVDLAKEILKEGFQCCCNGFFVRLFKPFKRRQASGSWACSSLARPFHLNFPVVGVSILFHQPAWLVKYHQLAELSSKHWVSCWPPILEVVGELQFWSILFARRSNLPNLAWADAFNWWRWLDPAAVTSSAQRNVAHQLREVEECLTLLLQASQKDQLALLPLIKAPMEVVLVVLELIVIPLCCPLQIGHPFHHLSQ